MFYSIKGLWYHYFLVICMSINSKITDDMDFLKRKGDYRNLIVYKKAECIYDLTYYFVGRYLGKGDRTVDQMLQAARSGKQNIIEGSAASTTSRETEIKLFNVAKASFDELLADYNDYLRVRELAVWSDEKMQKVREFCREHNDSAFYRGIAPLRDDATLANLCVTMIHQEIYLLLRLIERAKSDFLRNGGIREEMSRARREYRGWQQREMIEDSGKSGKSGSDGSDGNSGNSGSGGKSGNGGNGGK